jgi:hypothetical protein
LADRILVLFTSRNNAGLECPFAIPWDINCQRECKNYPLGETKIYPPAKKGDKDGEPRCMLPPDDCVGRRRDDQR